MEAYETSENAALDMGCAIVLKVKKGYAKTALKEIKARQEQTESYSKMYDMDACRVAQARIFQNGNYIGYFILGQRDDSGNKQNEAKLAASAGKKIDSAWKSVFGKAGKNLA
ncbi:MAG: hypothetical protein IJ733_20475 [Lachnospiraceae bacterium]|nr:hypothetical protein [Lachnospiraceae bacterium]